VILISCAVADILSVAYLIYWSAELAVPYLTGTLFVTEVTYCN